MSIYENQTFIVTSLKDTLEIISNIKKTKIINLFHPYNSLIWQGPNFVKIINDQINNKKINFIVESGTNIGLTLSLIDLGIKKIAISKKLNNEILLKINSIAKKKKIKIYYTEKFKSLK